MDASQWHNLLCTDRSGYEAARAEHFADSDVRPRITGQRFQNADLSGLDLSRIDFNQCEFFGCNLAGADLSDCLLRMCRFRSCDLSGARLAASNLARGEAIGCNLTGADLTAASLLLEKLYHSDFSGAILNNADFSAAEAPEVSFRNVQAERCFWHKADLRNCDFTGALLSFEYPGTAYTMMAVAGIGGVLEPLQANPVIIEDNCFIGARAEVAEGVIVGEGSVLSMGVYLGQSTKIVDRATGFVHYGRVPPYSVVVSGAMPGKPLPDGSAGPSLYCAVIVKTVDEQTRSKTSINELLRD